MALSEPAPREALHHRDIELRGYRRADGLFDIEASIIDTKTYAFSNTDRGEVLPGTPLHHMVARMTFGADLVITAFEAETRYGPYSICPDAAPLFARLAGVTVGRGFMKAVQERVGGVHGCTHLRELLPQMATVAIQTMFSMRRHDEEPAVNAVENAARPMLLNTCLAYASDGPVARRQWPAFYTGPE